MSEKVCSLLTKAVMEMFCGVFEFDRGEFLDAIYKKNAKCGKFCISNKIQLMF